jgi:hypothetical protein
MVFSRFSLSLSVKLISMTSASARGSADEQETVSAVVLSSVEAQDEPPRPWRLCFH